MHYTNKIYKSRSITLSFKNLLTCSLVFCLGQSISLAEEDTTTMVITPSRFEQDIKQVGSSISVISKKEIEEKKLQNVGDVLRTVEGLQILQSGGPGSITSVFLRGSSSSQVLVMIDSIPVNEVNSGQFDFADLSTLSIDHIEILKGPQSVVYGSSALGGVINIITSKGDNKSNAKFQLEGGSYGTQKYLAAGNFGQEKLKGQVSASIFDTHNISQANAKNGNSEKDPYQNQTLSAGLTYKPIDNLKVIASGRYTKGQSQLDTFDYSRGVIDSPNYNQNKEAYQSNLQIDSNVGIWNPKLIFGYNQENYRASDPDVDFNNYQLKSNTLSLQQQNVFKFNSQISTLVGYSYQQNSGQSVGNFDKNRYVNSAFIEQFFNPFDTTNISIGGRHDDDSTFGGANTYRASIAQHIDQLNSKLHSSYGTGFRAPSFSDLYYPNFSNPNLNPEKSRGFDFGIASNFQKFNTDVTYFHTNYTGLINFNDTTFLPENIDRAKTQGIESKINFDLTSETDITLKYTYLDAYNVTSKSLLPRRARHQGSLSIVNNYFEKITLRSDITAFADRVESDGRNMDDYLIVSGSAQYNYSENIMPYIRLQNLFDREYEEVKGYGTLGSGIYAGIQYRM